MKDNNLQYTIEQVLTIHQQILLINQLSYIGGEEALTAPNSTSMSTIYFRAKYSDDQEETGFFDSRNYFH